MVFYFHFVFNQNTTLSVSNYPYKIMDFNEAIILMKQTITQLYERVLAYCQSVLVFFLYFKTISLVILHLTQITLFESFMLAR